MKRLIGVFIVVLIIVQGVTAQDIISAKALAKIYKKPTTTIISVRKAESFAKMHINGAIHINLKDMYKPASVKVKGVLKSDDELAAFLGKKGVSSSNTIVIYDRGNYKFAGRLYWILKYLGAKDVRVLDGQLKAWQAARKPVTKTKIKAKPATFKLAVNKSILATTRDVKAIKPNSNVILIDARSKEEFDGTKGHTLKLGRIPNAKHFEFSNITNGAKLKANATIQTLFTKAGITKDKEIILYCETSVRAGVLFLALKGLGYTKVKVYDGAFYKWTSLSSNKIIK